MTDKKNKFLGMAKATLGVDKPTNLADFLDNTEDKQNARQAVTTENRNSVQVENQMNVSSKQSAKSVREEFRLKPELAARLRKYAYEKYLKKTDIVTLALEKFFDSEGY